MQMGQGRYLRFNFPGGMMQHKILIVDDDPAARYGLKRALAALGCEIVEAEDGEAALVAVAQDNPDFVDLRYPDAEDGWVDAGEAVG